MNRMMWCAGAVTSALLGVALSGSQAQQRAEAAHAILLGPMG